MVPMDGEYGPGLFHPTIGFIRFRTFSLKEAQCFTSNCVYSPSCVHHLHSNKGTDVQPRKTRIPDRNQAKCFCSQICQLKSYGSPPMLPERTSWLMNVTTESYILRIRTLNHTIKSR